MLLLPARHPPGAPGGKAQNSTFFGWPCVLANKTPSPAGQSRQVGKIAVEAGSPNGRIPFRRHYSSPAFRRKPPSEPAEAEGLREALQVPPWLGLLLVYFPAAGFYFGTGRRFRDSLAHVRPRCKLGFPAHSRKKRLIRFWKERQIYEKTLAARAGAPSFVFYEGPPTANGLPHPGHCLTRAIKDLFPRYKTMRGFCCQRKAGWDTHGLPVEVEVCKELGIHAKEEIEAYGIEPFIHKCIESVFRYMQQWEELTERLGFWIHLDEAYVTFHQSYVESVWWALKTFFERGLLYQGHKIVWWWAQGGTALSSGEVGQGYREVADPSVFVRFPLVKVPVARTGRGAGGEGDNLPSPLRERGRG